MSNTIKTRIAADLSLLGEKGEHLGQYPVLKAENSPLLKEFTREDFLTRKALSPELGAAIDEILQNDFKEVAEPAKKKK